MDRGMLLCMISFADIVHSSYSQILNIWIYSDWFLMAKVPFFENLILTINKEFDFVIRKSLKDSFEQET